MTAVDIMMSFPLTAAAARVPDVKKYPLIAAYVERVQKVEGYKRAVRKVEEVEGEEFKVI